MLVSIRTNRDKIYKTQPDMLNETTIRIAFEPIPGNEHSRYVADYTMKAYTLMMAERHLIESFEAKYSEVGRKFRFEEYLKALEEALSEKENE